MIKTNKKGFTIVELVVVITVIAILAAVLIPTISSLVNKANQSADIQAVRQMNTALAIYSAEESPKDLIDAINALEEQNINLDNYTPLTSDTQFYWVKSENRIVYAELNSDGTCGDILYPQEAAKWTYTAGDWFVLNGTIKRETIDYTSVTKGSLSISNAGQFAQLAEDYANTRANSVTNIVLNNDIDLSGAQATFGKITSSIEIDGNSHTIYGLRASKNVSSGYVNENAKKYGYGLFGNIAEGATVTIKNAKFVGVNVGDVASQILGNVGLLAGEVNGTLNIENVTFENCSVTGHQNVGALVGKVCNNGAVSISGNVSFTNVTVRGYLATAKLIGYITEKGKVTVSSGATLSGDGVTVEELVEARTLNITSIENNGRKWAEFESDAGDKYCVWYKSGDENVGGVCLQTTAWAWKCHADQVGTYAFEGQTYAYHVKSISTFDTSTNE